MNWFNIFIMETFVISGIVYVSIIITQCDDICQLEQTVLIGKLEMRINCGYLQICHKT